MHMYLGLPRRFYKNYSVPRRYYKNLNFYVFCAGELVQEIQTEDDGRYVDTYTCACVLYLCLLKDWTIYCLTSD